MRKTQLTLCLLGPGLVFAVLWTQTALSLSQRPVLSGPDEDYLNTRVVFTCEAPTTAPMVYELLKDTQDQPIAVKNLQEGQSAKFNWIVSRNFTGSYRCRVRSKGSLAPPLYSNSLYFQVIIPVKGTYLTSDPSPAVLYEGQRLTLLCQVHDGSHLSYTWLLNRSPLANAPLGSTLVISQASQLDTGNYSCSAWNNLPNRKVSYSSDLQVTVKVLLIRPYVMYTATKDDSGYHAEVTCCSAKGTPPVSFHLFLNGTMVANRSTLSLSAHFTVPVRLGHNMGELWCEAQSGVQQLASAKVTLEVVPVGGALHLQVEYLYNAASMLMAVMIHCVPTRGTFPEFAWFLNGTRLDTVWNSHIIINQGRSLLLTPVTAGNSEHYHCEVKDSFDNTSWIRSQANMINTAMSHMVPLDVIAVVFNCFLLLVIVGGACLVFAWGCETSSSIPIYSTSRPSIFDLLEIPPRHSPIRAEMVCNEEDSQHWDPSVMTEV